VNKHHKLHDLTSHGSFGLVINKTKKLKKITSAEQELRLTHGHAVKMLLCTLITLLKWSILSINVLK